MTLSRGGRPCSTSCGLGRMRCWLTRTFCACRRFRCALRPKVRALVTVVTPFGRIGPWSGDAATPATMFAASGESSITPGGPGYEQFPDRPPLTGRGQVTEIDGGVICMLVTTAALTATPPDVAEPVINDVAIYEASVSHNRWLVTNFDRLDWIETRQSNSYSYGGLLPCADGFVMFLAPADRHWKALVEMMGRPDWAADERFKTYDGRKEGSERIRIGITEWAGSRTKEELLRLGLEFSVPIGPFRDVSEVAKCPQLRHRGFYRAYGSGETGALVPGLPDGIARCQLDIAPQLNADADTVCRSIKETLKGPK